MRLLLILLLLAFPAHAERRVALVLAAEEYRDLRPLATPTKDALAVEEMLTSLGFEVTVETDRDLRRTRRALEDFVADYQGADVALVFYAGHGVEIGGVNYLLPVDAKADTAAAIAETALPLAEVQAAMGQVAPVGIVLLDACREDPFGGGTGEGRAAAPLDDTAAPAPRPGLGRIGRADGVLFAFSAAPGEVASDGQGDHSPFAEALLRHFSTPGVEVRTALTLVQQDVYDRSRGRQLPYVESGLPQTLYLTGQGDLAERDQLLLAMSQIAPDLRAEVEALGAAENMPLAPLYAALISANLSSLSQESRRALLADAVGGYRAFQDGLATFASDDPKVAALRQKAEAALELGASQTARDLLDQAAALDETALSRMQDGVEGRNGSWAQTRILYAQTAMADLQWDLAIEALESAIARLDQMDHPGLEPGLRTLHASALWDLGDLYQRKGETGKALAAYQAWQRFAETRLAEAPQDPRLQRDLMASLAKVAQMQGVLGNLAEAIGLTQKAVALAQALAAQSSGIDEADRDVMISQNKLGDLLTLAGDLAGAETAYSAALGLAKALAEQAPDDPLVRADLARASQYLGRIRLSQGALEEAGQLQSAALATYRQLADGAPTDASAQRELAAALVSYGDVLVAQGKPQAAKPLYDEARDVTAKLVQRDPDSAEAQRDLATAFSKIGDASYLLGQAQPAFDAYSESLRLTEDLALRDPANVQWQVDLAISHYLLAGASSDRLLHMQTAISILDGLANNGTLPPMHADLAGKMRAELAETDGGTP